MDARALPFLREIGAPYRAEAPRVEGALRLDGNTGAAPTLTGDLSRALVGLERYPDTASLAARLAARLGVDEDEVLVTAGADDALDRACRLALSSGGRVVVPTPAFEMTLRYARRAGGDVVEVPWGDAFPERALLDAIDDDTRLVVLTSPNNPCGRLVPEGVVTRVAARATKALVVVDEAYGEYAPRTLFDESRGAPNVVVVRTLSKAWGLAALRTGYAVGAPALIDGLRAVGAPYAVSGPSVALACAVLDGGDAPVRAHVARTTRARGTLLDVLARLGLPTRASEASFVLVDASGVPGGARVFARLLAGAGVIVRTFCGRAGLEDCVRIGVPDDDEGLRRLVAALECVLRPEALLFDMDGVLVDVSASYRAAIVETALRFGVSLTSADVAREKARGDANDDWALTARLIAARGREAPLDEVTRVFEALYQGAGDVPGLAARERAMFSTDELARVGARARLGVVTGRPRRDAERFLRTARQDAHFAVVVAREDAPLKPAPDPVALAMARLGVTRAWMFGDTVDDVRAARAAGVLAIGVVAPGEADRVEARRALEAAGAALVVDEPRALLEVLP